LARRTPRRMRPARSRRLRQGSSQARRHAAFVGKTQGAACCCSEAADGGRLNRAVVNLHACQGRSRLLGRTCKTARAVVPNLPLHVHERALRRRRAPRAGRAASRMRASGWRRAWRRKGARACSAPVGTPTALRRKRLGLSPSADAQKQRRSAQCAAAMPQLTCRARVCARVRSARCAPRDRKPRREGASAAPTLRARASAQPRPATRPPRWSRTRRAARVSAWPAASRPQRAARSQHAPTRMSSHTRPFTPCRAGSRRSCRSAATPACP
jgi:hypothetical protein